jgi:hypothetical protein
MMRAQRSRRMARRPAVVSDRRARRIGICGDAIGVVDTAQRRAGAASKIERILAAISQSGGASMLQLMLLTGWRAHSVRAAISAVLRKKRHIAIVRKRRYGLSRYVVSTDGLIQDG